MGCIKKEEFILRMLDPKVDKSDFAGDSSGLYTKTHRDCIMKTYERYQRLKTIEELKSGIDMQLPNFKKTILTGIRDRKIPLNNQNQFFKEFFIKISWIKKWIT